MFDGDQLRGLQGQLEPFRSLADPLTVRRAVLLQMQMLHPVFLARHPPLLAGFFGWCDVNAGGVH